MRSRDAFPIQSYTIYAAIQLHETNSTLMVCCKHFISGELQNLCMMVLSSFHCKGAPAKLFDTTNPDWVPTQNMIHIGAKDYMKSMSRYNRLRTRKRQQHSANPEDDLETTSEPPNNDTFIPPSGMQ